MEDFFQEVLQEMETDKNFNFQRVFDGSILQQSVRRFNSQIDSVDSFANTAVPAVTASATYNAIELAHMLHNTTSSRGPESTSPSKTSESNISRKKWPASKKRSASSKSKSAKCDNDKASLTSDSEDSDSVSSVHDNIIYEPKITEKCNDLINGIDNNAYQSESETGNNDISEKL